jgi:ATP-dependent Clp protease ATP-binding subunit ClpC
LGRTVDFRRTILIMTSNTGFNVGPGVGFSPTQIEDTQPLKHLFAPEFLDRLDDIIRFRALGEAELIRVASSLLEDMREELASREITIDFAPEVAAWLVAQLKEKTNKHATGSSRRLRTLVRTLIEDPLSIELMDSGNFITIHIEGNIAKFERGLAVDPEVFV